MSAPLHTFTSHVAGKNAKVSVFTDRLEWERPTKSGPKLLLGVVTVGISLLFTGLYRRTGSTEMIPVRSISSIATKRAGTLNTDVSVVTSGNTIDFRVSHAEAATVKETLQRLILNRD